jgi:hypothetical protein
MKKIIIFLLLNQIGLVLFSQDNYTLLTKEVGKFRFEALQTKNGKIIRCLNNGNTTIVWQESRILSVDSINEINMFDSVFVMKYTTPNAYYWNAIVWDGKSWNIKVIDNLPSYDYAKITEVRMLSNNLVSVNTLKDSIIYKYNLNILHREENRIISFRKIIGTHKYEVRTNGDFTQVLDYHDGKIDTILPRWGNFVKIKDIGVFGEKFLMVFEEIDGASIISMIWNGNIWKRNFYANLYDIDTSGEPPTTLTILDEKTIRYQRRGETTIAKIDIENKKITQEKE